MKGMNFTYNISEIEEFLKTCPEGLMTKRKFVDLSALALGGKSQFLADALFRNLTCKPIMFLEIALIFLSGVLKLETSPGCLTMTIQELGSIWKLIFYVFKSWKKEKMFFLSRISIIRIEGAMDFAEYMLAINATNLNTPQVERM